MSGQLFAAIDVGLVALLIPIVAILMGGFIAVAKMIMLHQTKMAEMVKKEGSEPGVAEELRAMRGELSDLRDRVNQQTLAIESSQSPRAVQRTEPPDMPERLSE